MSESNITIQLLSRSRKTRQIKGATLAEALVTIVILGVLGSIAAPNILATGSNPLPDTTNQIAGQFRSARAKAISQTSLYRIRPTNTSRNATIATCADPTPIPPTDGCVNNQLIVERSTAITTTSCDAATGWVQDNYFTPEDVTLGKGISISKVEITAVEPTVRTNWQLCFDSRGVADKNLVLTLRQSSDSRTRQIEIFPGGTVQIREN